MAPSLVYSRRLTTESMSHCTQLRRDRQAREKKAKENFPNLEVGLYTQRTQRKLKGELDGAWFFTFFLPSEPKQTYVKNLKETMTHLYGTSKSTTTPITM
jgi:hypothetical protein